MRSTANTRRRKESDLKAAVRAEKKIKGQKAERRVTSIKVMTGEVARGAKIEMLIRKKRSPNLITAKTETRVPNLIKGIKKTQRVEMVREQGQSPEAKKEKPKKMSVDQVAETEAGLQHRKREKKNERKTESGAESAAGVGTGDATAKGRLRGEGHPGNVEQEAQTEARPGTRTEAGARGAGAPGETRAGIGPPIERSKTERLPASGGGEEAAAAAALRATETKRRVKGAQIPKGEPSPKSDGARPAKDQTARKRRREMIARRIAPAPAPTATKPLIMVLFFYSAHRTQLQLSIYSEAYSHSPYSTDSSAYHDCKRSL